jgi:hypothetical protein
VDGAQFIGLRNLTFFPARAAVSLNPAAAGAVQRPDPKANLFRPQGTVWHFQDDAAHVFVGEESLPLNFPSSSTLR